MVRSSCLARAGLVGLCAWNVAASSPPATVSIKVDDFAGFQGLKSLNLRGDYETKLGDNTVGLKYEVNKSPMVPTLLASRAWASSHGNLKAALSLDPKTREGVVKASVQNADLGVLETTCDSRGKMGLIKWTSKKLVVPLTEGDPKPFVIRLSHDPASGQNAMDVRANLSPRTVAKLDLPAEARPRLVVTNVRPLKDGRSYLEAAADVLKVVNQGFWGAMGDGALRLAYKRDLDTAPGAISKFTVEADGAGVVDWSLSNETKRMKLVLKGDIPLDWASQSSVSLHHRLSLF